MNKNRNEIINGAMPKRAAGKPFRWVAGALLCVIFAGCGKTDQALPISFGEALVWDEESPAEAVTDEVDLKGAAWEQQDLEEAQLYVYVCGAVNAPGVVILPAGSRCNDALIAAGGFREDAARESVNLAELVEDGAQIYFPTIQEAEEADRTLAKMQAGLVDINTADVELLCSLPGIGEAKARAIVAYREQNGDFPSIESVMQVPGIKESAYSQIKDLIIVK